MKEHYRWFDIAEEHYRWWYHFRLMWLAIAYHYRENYGIIFQYASTHIYPAVITKVLHDNVVNLVAFSAIN